MSFKVGEIAMKQRRNVLLTLLVVVLCLLATFAFADGKSADFKYKVLDDGTIEITKYIGNTSYIDFPSEIDGHTISSIGVSAFEGSSKLQKIYYFNETSVTVIGDCAFKDCTALKYIDMPESLTSIGDSAFEGCTSMEKAYYLDSSAVTSIGKRAFFGCTALKYIDIPAGLTTVQESSFEGCTSMEKAYYMDASAVISFDNRAFYGCTALKYIDIPQCATTIIESAFEGCTDLEKIYYLGDSSVTIISKNAFKNCTDLQYFDAPATLTEIGESAFEGCTSLKRIYYLNENNVSFGVNAFANCPNLKDMPKGATVDASKLSATSETPSPAPTVAATEIPTVAITPSNPDGWICPNCGYDAIGNFCNNCGNPKPEETVQPEQNLTEDWVCPNCGYNATGNFCNNCGNKRNTEATTDASTPTPEPTATPQPTAQPAPAAKWTGDVKKLSSGTYYVGSDLLAGTYLFRQIEGDDYVPVIYVYNSDQEKVDSGSADKNGCVLNLKDGQIVKISWTKAYVSLFDTTWSENETKTLPSGTYYVGTDIPAGSYQFTKIEGDDYTPVMYVYNVDNLKDKVDSGSASDTGCALNLKEGQVLKITWTAAIASKLDLEWTDGEKTLPSGTYYIGTDLPAGIYHFKHIEGDDYTPVLYVYDANNLKDKVDSASASDVGCILRLKEGQVLKIAWTATITSKFDIAFANGETKLLPSGSYYIGTDLPAGTYSFIPIQGDDYTPVLYVYNADNLEKKIDSASVYNSGCSMNLNDEQVLQITWTGTYATLSNSVGMALGPIDSTSTPIPTTTSEPIKSTSTPTPTSISDPAAQTTLDEKNTEDEKTLLPGTYHAGTDLPAGTYIFRQTDGHDFIPLVSIYDADQKEVESCGADINGCVLSVKEDQTIKITYTKVYVSEFDTTWPENEEKVLLPGTYYIGIDIPVGSYTFVKSEGNTSFPMLYVYNADNLIRDIDSASITSDERTFDLKDGQVLKVTGAMVAKLNLDLTEEENTVATIPNSESAEEPKHNSNSDGSLESVVAYMLSPNDSSLQVNIVDLGEGSFTASAAGKSYYGYYFAEDDSYMIEMALTGSGSYDSVDSPFDFTSEGFKQLLNFLLKKNGRTVTSVYPILGEIYGAKDSKGTTYMIQVAYSESMIVVSLITWN